MSLQNEGLSEDYSNHYWEQFLNSHLSELQHASPDKEGLKDYSCAASIQFGVGMGGEMFKIDKVKERLRSYHRLEETKAT